jgi:FKBP-type peptidyl-prolyl cis-trans isomerase
MKKQDIIFAIGLLIAVATGIYFIFGMNVRPTDNSPLRLSDLQKEQDVQSAQSESSEIPENLIIKDTVEGTGPAVKSGDRVSLHYIGYLEDGTRFDTSAEHGEPFETQIGVGRVIKGWDLGVIGMKVGGQRRLTIPPELAYEDRGSGPIPPNATIIFDLELLEIK